MHTHKLGNWSISKMLCRRSNDCAKLVITGDLTLLYHQVLYFPSFALWGRQGTPEFLNHLWHFIPYRGTAWQTQLVNSKKVWSLFS